MGLLKGFLIYRLLSLLFTWSKSITSQKTLVIDGDALLHYCCGENWDYILEGNCRELFVILYSYMNGFKSWGIKTIVVFSGKWSEDKEMTDTARDDKRNVARYVFDICYRSFLLGCMPGECKYEPFGSQ